MGDRVRQIAKRSTSKLHITKGSVSHIGAIPYRFRLDVFISYVDNLKHVAEVSVSWERRGKEEVTSVVKVKDKKAIFRESLSMEATLFRRSGATPKASSPNLEELKFDEKKAKFLLRKGASDGKPIGKIVINLADYVRGTNSTVFADMKLSNGAVIVTKIEATMLHMGKKKKNNGSRAADSEACSEMSDLNSAENDSIFGDDDVDIGALEIETLPAPSDDLAPTPVSQRKTSDPSVMSPISSGPSSNAFSVQRKQYSQVERELKETGKRFSEDLLNPLDSGVDRSENLSGRGPVMSLKKEERLDESPSLKIRLKSKMKGKKDKDKEWGKNNSHDLHSEPSKKKLGRQGPSRDHAAEISELKACIESLKKENTKVKKSKQSAMEEIEALRADLEACETALEEAAESSPESPFRAAPDLSNTLKEKDKKFAELQAQNDSLLEELENLHESVLSKQIAALTLQVEDLEIALRREPQYMDVVNDLKVTKVSLALAHMEKEQAQFALQIATHGGEGPKASEYNY